jgi:hypothetical protein
MVEAVMTRTSKMVFYAILAVVIDRRWKESGLAY